MDRGSWWATVHGVAKSRDMTERLTFPASFNTENFPSSGGKKVQLNKQDQGDQE